MSIEMEELTHADLIAQSQAVQANKALQTEKLPALFDKVLSALVSKQNEVTALMAQLDEMKAMQVDALGDGFYDGYLQCQKDVNDEQVDIYSVNDSDVLQWAEDYESDHRYSKSIADIRAKAGRDGFMTAINLIRLRPERANHAVFVNAEAEKYANNIRQAAKVGAA
jgi:hypothetical protein